MVWDTVQIFPSYGRAGSKMAVCGQAAPGRGSRRVQEVHHYADLFWNRKKYPRELEQYQKLAVLTALKAVESPRWTKYAQLVGQEDEEWLRLAAVGCKPHGRDVNG
ncbi:MAG: hypothetical protein KH271_14515 [Clostridiales bacterium]|nr:hypothetical protein [Clostridiales bacterium]